MTEYVLPRRGAEELEARRLELVAQYHDPFTLRALDAIGVAEGWRCLDIGAGAGAVTRLLAERVGATGRVLATDLDTRLLEPLADDRIEIRRHDLLADPLREGDFDLAHARLVLLHLPSRIEALRRLAAAVRPGGWVAIGEVDFGTVDVSPASSEWARAWSAFLDAVIAAGWDPRYGTRIRSDLEAIGLVDVQGEQFDRAVRGGSPGARLVALTFERLRTLMVALGASDEDVDAAIRVLDDPATAFVTPAVYTAWGRKP